MPRRNGRTRLAWMTAAVATPLLTLACQGWDPRIPFERESPQVREATQAYDAGDAAAAARMLADYLGTGVCKDGQIGAPPSLGDKREGTFDLGLALFGVAETFGARFQDPRAAGTPPGAQPPKARTEMIACALRIARSVLESPSSDYALRARAHYLEGNLHFLSEKYAEAVKSYERALVLVPGEGDAGDPVGRDAAWNRAVALRRIEDQKDASAPDSGSSDGGGGEGGSDASSGGNDTSDSGSDSGKDNKDGGSDSGKGKDDPKDKDKDKDKDKSGKDKDGGGSSGQPQPQSQDPNEQNKDEEDGGGAAQNQPAQSQPEGQSASPDERVLDSLERAPMLQHELSRRQSNTRKVRGSADK